jgi:hypothetical protein
MKKVSLAETYTAVNEERIVALARLLRDAHRCGMTELVAVTDYEISKRIAWIDVVIEIAVEGVIFFLWLCGGRLISGGILTGLLWFSDPFYNKWRVRWLGAGIVN